jgi:hypothetical protein
MFTFADLKLGWKIKPVHRWDRLTFEPQVSIYNLFNRQNFDSPSQPLSGILNNSAGTLNGTTRANRSNSSWVGVWRICPGRPSFAGVRLKSCLLSDTETWIYSGGRSFGNTTTRCSNLNPI